MKARVLGLMSGSVVLAIALPGFAQAPPSSAAAPKGVTLHASVTQVIAPKVSDMMGRMTGDLKRMGVGVEQTKTQYVKVGDKNYVTVVYMATTGKDRGNYTIECASYELQEKSAPVAVVSRVKLCDYDADRGCNHPALSMPDDGGNLLLTYGSDYMQDRPSAMAEYISYKCEKLSTTPLRYSFDPKVANANDGASHAAPYLGKDAAGGSMFLANYTSTNGDLLPRNGLDDGLPNDDDMQMINMVHAVKSGPGLYELKLGWPKVAAGETVTFRLEDDNDPATVDAVTVPRDTAPVPMYTMADIGRGFVKQIDATRGIHCSSAGDNRPPEVGIVCTVFDLGNGNRLSYGTVLKSDPEKHIYWNQVTIDNLPNGKIALHALKSNGMGKNTDIKGINEGLTMVLELRGDAVFPIAQVENAAVHQTHSAICAGLTGVEGQEHATIGIVSASPSGVGRGAMRFVHFDDAAKTLLFDGNKDTIPTSFYADSGKLSNMYGDNPMEQGRNYLHCNAGPEGKGVPNPGYNKEGGYMKDVKTFFITANEGREPGFMRNSMVLSLVPAITNKPVLSFGNPVEASQVQSSPDAPAPTPAPAAQDPSGCACSTPGSTGSSSNMVGGLVLLGLALGGIASRRRS